MNRRVKVVVIAFVLAVVSVGIVAWLLADRNAPSRHKTVGAMAAFRPTKGFVADVKSGPQENQEVKEAQTNEGAGLVTMLTVANKGQREQALRKSIQEAMAR